MTVLLSCSMNLSASNNDTIPSMGGLKQDSVLIAYSDLRKVNGKLIELEYEKDINERLRTIISNDSIAIHTLRNSIDSINLDADKRVNKIKRERNVAIGTTIVSIILLVLSIL